MISWYARRAVAWLPLLACTALGTLFAVVELSRGGGWEPLGYALFGLVPAAACVVDEPAAAVVDSAVSSLLWRTLARMSVLALPAGVFLGLVLWVDWRASAPTALLLADGWVLMGLAFAATVVLRRFAYATPSRWVAPASVLLLTADLLLAGHLPSALNPLNVESHAPWLRIGLLTVVAVGLVAAGTKDEGCAPSSRLSV